MDSRLSNHIFISQICLRNSHSMEQICTPHFLAICNGMRGMVWEYDDIKYKYYCLSAGIIYKSVISLSSKKWRPNKEKGTQILLVVYVNLILDWWLFRSFINVWSFFSSNVHIKKTLPIYLNHTKGFSVNCETHFQIHPWICKHR